MEQERKKLGTLIVEAGLATPLQIDNALQSQHVFGGSLGTNLVEMGIIDANALAAFLSKQFGIPEATQHELNNITSDVLKLIPASAAEKLCLLPLYKEGPNLVVTMMDPSDERIVKKIEDNLGHKLIFKVASELEIKKSLKKYYDIPLTTRFIHLLGQADSLNETPPVSSENLSIEKHLDKIISTSEAIRYYFEQIKALDCVPVLDYVGDITRYNLTSEMIFIFQQVDGSSTIHEIISLNIFTRLSTLRTLVYFSQLGMIKFMEKHDKK